MRYLWSVVRFVPEPARGEFVNVGVIVGSDATGTWCCRASAANRRAQALDRHGTLPAAQEYLATVQRAIAASPSDVSEAWLGREHQALNGLIQLSEPIPMAAPSLEDAIARLLESLVDDPD